jgi:hypothetical protein
MKPTYKPGSWNAICDVCGFQHKAEELQKRWDGLMVCKEDFETRHPQTLLRVPTDNPSLPWSRPEPPDTYINVPYITPPP